MHYPAKRLYVIALVVCLLAGAQARADFVAWNYNWTPGATEILADNPATGKLILTNEPGGSAVGDSYIVATNIKTASNADPSNPANFTNKAYALTLAITDVASSKTGSMTFAGVFNGTMTNKSAIIMNNFTGPQTQSVTIGNHLYTVQIGPFAPPGPPTANISGSISALANVKVSDVPEPSTLVLSGLCLGLCGAGWWYRRLRGRSLAVEMA